MRKRTFLLAGLLAFSMAFGFSGCGGEESGQADLHIETDLTSTAASSDTTASSTESTVFVTADVSSSASSETTTTSEPPGTSSAITEKPSAVSSVAPVQSTVSAVQPTAPSATQAQTSANPIVPSSDPLDIPTISTTGGVTRIENHIIIANSGTDHPRAIEPFWGSFPNGKRYGQLISQYAAAVGSNVHTWLMSLPTAQAFYQPDDVPLNNGTQQQHFENICSALKGATGVPVIDAIAPHKNEPLYSRTDYHWQPLAAYYAAEQFAAKAGVPYAPLSTYEKKTGEGYLGAFYRVNKIQELAKYPEPFTYYKPADVNSLVCTYYDTKFKNGTKNKLFFEGGAITYCVFVGRDNCILQVDTQTNNNRVLVIFKDSFGNALVPFLTQSFSKIYLCDIRYFDINAISFIKNVGATDLLFAISTTNSLSKRNLDYIENNMKK